MTKHLVSILTRLNEEHEVVGDHWTVAMCVIGEALALLSTFILSGSKKDEHVSDVLQKARPIMEKLVTSNPRSLWVVKSGAAFAKALQQLEVTFSDDVDEMFDEYLANNESFQEYYKHNENFPEYYHDAIRHYFVGDRVRGDFK